MHVEPPQITLINSNNDDKLDKDCVKIKLHGYPTPEKLDIYELKMDFFDIGEPQDFLLFVRNFQITFEAS